MSFLIQNKPEKTLGSSFATGLGDALAHLANGKVESYRKHQHTKDLLKSGIPKEYAQLIPHLNEHGTKSFWNSFNFGKLLPEGQQEEGQAGQEDNSWYQPYGNSSFDQDLKREKFQEQKRLAAEKEQSAINNQFQERFKGYEKFNTIGTELETTAQAALDLLDKIEAEGGLINPLLESGIQGLNKVTKGVVDLSSLAGEDAATLRSLYNSIVTTKTALLKGQPSNLKVGILQGEKPSLHQPIGTQRTLLQKAVREGKTLRIPYQETLKITEANGGNYPKKFPSIIEPIIQSRYDELHNPKYDSEEGAIQQAIQEGRSSFEVTDDDTGEQFHYKIGKDGKVSKFKVSENGELKRV